MPRSSEVYYAWFLVFGATAGMAHSQQCGTTWSFNPSGSKTSLTASWRLVDPGSRMATFQLGRYVAYSSTPKYMSFAFAKQNRMGPTDLVVDCYEVPDSAPTVGTSKNFANHTNMQDLVIDSQLLNGTASRAGNQLNCSFTMSLPTSTAYALFVAGQVVNGTKQHHSEWFISVPLSFTCADPANVAVAQPVVSSDSSGSPSQKPIMQLMISIMTALTAFNRARGG